MDVLFDIQSERKRLDAIGVIDQSRRDHIVNVARRVLSIAADHAPIGALDLVASDVVKAHAMLDASTPANVKDAAINALVVFNGALTASDWAEEKRLETYREAHQEFERIVANTAITLGTLALVAFALFLYVEYRRTFT